MSLVLSTHRQNQARTNITQQRECEVERERMGKWADRAKTLIFSFLAVRLVCTVMKLMRNYCRRRQAKPCLSAFGAKLSRKNVFQLVIIMFSYIIIIFSRRILFRKYTHLCTNSKLAFVDITRRTTQYNSCSNNNNTFDTHRKLMNEYLFRPKKFFHFQWCFFAVTRSPFLCLSLSFALWF